MSYELFHQAQARQLLLVTIGLLPLVGIPMYTYPLVQRPESACDVEVFFSSHRNSAHVLAKKVMVSPLRGRHQVYGVFMLPNAIQPGQPVVLAVKDVGVYCDIAVNSGNSVDGIHAPPQHYLMKDNIRTRTALLLIFSGKLDQLKHPSSWTLTYGGESALSCAKSD